MSGESGAKPENFELDELAQEVRRVIDDNRKFLERVMDDEFEDEDELEEEELPEEEL